MNIKSLLKAGIVAWVVIIICAICLVPIVGNEMEMALAKLSLPPLNNVSMVYFTFVSLFIGFILIWLYVVMLDRFKHRIKTAVITALIVWFLAYFLANVSMVVYGFMPVKLTIIGTSWGLIELLAASLIGSRFYKE